ncbi:hypothetical protein OHA98_41215 [Streptomyces sp. NBC_00654]|uniref:hypothetical protein n=1 Tax=Streptomyces sp. NBC_00654 TaxID=2975799 RepID=UPI00225B8283|nr:hypothetical protein [Streptomyces sp. NBC_00654]MCX4971036.1 hypothetical protein [Streptomyces sp. NBC_00654]
MTQSSEPSPLVAGLTRLIPSVVPVAGADPELVALGERYWALAGFVPELGTPVWCEKANDISVAGWGKKLYAVAAAGVRAVVPERECSQCGGALSLTSRTAFQQVLDDEETACVDCTPSLLEAVQYVIDPARKAKRERALVRELSQQAAQDARARWLAEQKEAIADDHPAVFPRDDGFPLTGVKEMVATLALLRFAPSTSPISRVRDWMTPLHPETAKASTIVASTIQSGLLAIHPSSSPGAFVWEPQSYEHALQQAGGDVDAVASPELTDRFYPLDASLFAPRGSSAGTAVKALDDHLAEELRPANMKATRQEDLLALAHELIAGEAIRYFTNQLDELNLPDVPANHTARLGDAVGKVSAHRPLNEIYNLAWRAVRSAAAAAQKNPRAPRANMTTYAVNQLESLAKRAVDEPDWSLKAFSEDPRCSAAAMTRVLFFNVLDANPLEATLPSLRASLPAPIPEYDGGAAEPDSAPTPVRETLNDLAWLGVNQQSWNPLEVPRLLNTISTRASDSPDPQVNDRVLAREATRLKDLYENLKPHLGEHHAAMAVFGAAQLLTHPLSYTDEQRTSGEFLQELMSYFLVKTEEE